MPNKDGTQHSSTKESQAVPGVEVSMSKENVKKMQRLNAVIVEVNTVMHLEAVNYRRKPEKSRRLTYEQSIICGGTKGGSNKLQKF